MSWWKYGYKIVVFLTLAEYIQIYIENQWSWLVRISGTVHGDDSGRAPWMNRPLAFKHHVSTTDKLCSFKVGFLTVILRRPGRSRGLFGHGFPGLIAITGLERRRLGVPQCTDYYRLWGNVIEETALITHVWTTKGRSRKMFGRKWYICYGFVILCLINSWWIGRDSISYECKICSYEWIS